MEGVYGQEWSKLGMIVLSTAGCAATNLVTAGILSSCCSVSKGFALNAASRIVSTLHAVIVCLLAAFVVHSSAADDELDERKLWYGVLSLTISFGYFVCDMVLMVFTGYEPLAPLMAHHVLSAGCMCWVAFDVPRAVWYACLLQCSEATVPINNYIWLLEERGRRCSREYCAARWLQLLVWLAVREALFVVFGWCVARHWAAMTISMKALGLCAGIPLALFNTGGLIAVILEGFPWWHGQPPAERDAKHD